MFQLNAMIQESAATWSPEALAQLVELVKAVFFGISIICVPLATVYIMVAAARAKRADEQAKKNEVQIQSVSKQIDGLLHERDAAKVKEGEATAEAAARDDAELLARGQREGREHERERISQQTAPELATDGSPIPVTDARATAAVEKLADAATRSADTMERVEGKAPKKKS